MRGYYILNEDRSVTPVGEANWMRAYEESADRRVGLTELEGGVLISTVFMPMDHAFYDGPPMIFETMVFPSKDNLSDVFCERYSTYAQAEAGHERTVSLVKEHLAAGKSLSEMPYSFEDDE